MKTIWISLLCLVSISAYSGNLKSKLVHAKEYKVIDELQTNMLNKRRAKMFIIISEAISFDERGQTAMLAAHELSKSHHLDLCEVILVPAKGLERTSLQEARASYASDNKGLQGSHSGVDPILFTKGKWMVWSSDQVLTDLELEVATLWHANRRAFPSKEMLSSLSFDPIALRNFIAEELQIDSSEVDFPNIQQKIYDSEIIKNWMRPNPHLDDE